MILYTNHILLVHAEDVRAVRDELVEVVEAVEGVWFLKNKLVCDI